MRQSRHRPHAQRGQALVEYVILLVMFVLVMFFARALGAFRLLDLYTASFEAVLSLPIP